MISLQKNNIEKIWYFVQPHAQFPSTYANNFQTMKMCSAFGSIGIETVMVAPKYISTKKKLSKLGCDPWTFYSVPQNFDIDWMPFYYPFPRLRRIVHSLVAKLYVHLKGINFVYTRSEWLASFLANQGIPTILELHQHYQNRNFLFTAKVAKNNPNLKAVVCISEALRNFVIDLGFPAEKILVASDGVDLERFSEQTNTEEAKLALGISGDKKVIGYVGHLYQGRGIDIIIEIAKKRPKYDFLIVGGNEKDVIFWKEYIKEENVDNMNLVGFKPNEKLPSYLYASDVLIMPYTEQSPTFEYMSPMKMFEYMAAKRPIVASDFSVIKEVLIDRKNALLIDPSDIGGYVKAIDLLLNDPQMSSSLAGNAYEDVQSHSWQNRALKIVSFVADTINE